MRATILSIIVPLGISALSLVPNVDTTPIPVVVDDASLSFPKVDVTTSPVVSPLPPLPEAETPLPETPVSAPCMEDEPCFDCHIMGNGVCGSPEGDVKYLKDLPPCDNEDGTVTSNGVSVSLCYWDATTRGNGVGDSFIVFSR